MSAENPAGVEVKPIDGATVDKQRRASWLTSETLTFLVLGLIGLYLTISSFELGVTTESSWVSAGTMPFGVGILLFVFSTLLLLQRVRAGRAAAQSVSSPSDEGVAAAAEDTSTVDVAADGEPTGEGVELEGAGRVRHLLLVSGALLAAIALTPLLGLLVAFGIMTIFLSAYVERKPLLPSIGIAVLAMGACYGIFRLFLSVPIPQGLFEGVF